MLICAGYINNKQVIYRYILKRCLKVLEILQLTFGVVLRQSIYNYTKQSTKWGGTFLKNGLIKNLKKIN